MKSSTDNDEIRIIAPSLSRQMSNNKRSEERAINRLEQLGFKITFGNNINNQFQLGTAKAADRLKDLVDAYSDKNVKAIMAYTGGWSSNELLPLIDWNLVKLNPKPLIGYSDISVLLMAIYSKTGNVGYLGPNFSTFGRMTAWQYTLDYFEKAIKQTDQFSLKRSNHWGDKPSKQYRTKPWKVLQAGETEGILIGGNLGSLYLLQGTEFQPNFNQPFILLAEDDDESGKNTAREFSRRLESILQIPKVRDNIKGIIIGRFQLESRVKMPDLMSIIASKKLGDIPVIANFDFGHTLPMLTLPIGGTLRIFATKNGTGILMK